MLNAAALGLNGEAGEIADHVKKVMFHGHPLDDATRDKIAKEIGDILWYCAMGARGHWPSASSDIARMNVEKLRKQLSRRVQHRSQPQPSPRIVRPDPHLVPAPEPLTRWYFDNRIGRERHQHCDRDKT